MEAMIFPRQPGIFKGSRPSNTAPLRDLILNRRSALKGASSGSPGWKEPMAAIAAPMPRQRSSSLQMFEEQPLVSRKVLFELQTFRICSCFQVFD